MRQKPHKWAHQLLRHVHNCKKLRPLNKFIANIRVVKFFLFIQTYVKMPHLSNLTIYCNYKNIMILQFFHILCKKKIKK